VTPLRCALSLFVLACGLTAPREARADSLFGPDKALHFALSTAIAVGSYGVATKLFDEPWQRATASGAFTLSVGAAKELWDATGHGDPSFLDFAWDAAGTAVGVGVCLTLDLGDVFASHDRSR
jgi:putative lipoprotein